MALALAVSRTEGCTAIFKRILLLLLAVLPGSTLILRGRFLPGTALMATAFVTADLALLGLGGLWLTPRSAQAGWAGAVAFGLCVLLSLVWTFVETSPRIARRREELADRSVRLAYLALLHDDLSRAEAAVHDGLARVSGDADLVFLGWWLARARGAMRRARRLHARLRRLDLDDKWCREIAREEALP